MKKFCIFLLLILLLLTACSKSDTPDQLTPEKMQEISDAWFAVKKEDLGLWYGEENGMGVHRVRYYGTYNGYIALFILPEMGASVGMTEIIGDETFVDNEPYSLYVYGDGEFIYLKDAYASGLVSKEDIAQIASIHRKFEGQP